jgi:hypothetical protein
MIVADPSHASRRMCRPCSADTPFPALVSPGPGALPHSRAPCSLDPHTREDNHAMELNGAHITRLSPPVSTIQCAADSKTPVWLAEGVSQEGTDSRPHCASETSLRLPSTRRAAPMPAPCLCLTHPRTRTAGNPKVRGSQSHYVRTGCQVQHHFRCACRMCHTRQLS